MKDELDLISIGNSKGIRIPKHLIEACGFKKTIHVDFKDGRLILSAENNSRKNWEKDFMKSRADTEDFQDLEPMFGDSAGLVDEVWKVLEGAGG